MTDVRVRFSPAPSGWLHIGSARTALFNWLFGRHNRGVFILRIEDTDASRSTEEAVDGAIDVLTWLGLDWDEGPIRQSGRYDLYGAAARRLVAEGNAYECYCTADELAARNVAAKEAGRPPGYDGHCRDLTDEQRAALAGEGRTHVVRFRTPADGVSTFRDAIRGDVSVDWHLIHDFVVLRADGSPIFFLANAVDDIDMGITHVIRGEDLLDSTHRVLALRAALGGGQQPVYAHLPLIVDAQSRAKLSKRHGVIALEDFRNDGYLPEALMNYLALQGWAPAGSESGDEIMSSTELVAAFDLDHVTHAAAGFDRKKLDWMNGQWIRRLPLEELVTRVEPAARARYGDRYDEEIARSAIAVAQERAVTLNEIVDSMDFLFVADDEFEIAPESWEKVVATERVEELFDVVIAHLISCEWTHDAIDLRPAIESLGLKPRKAMPALYAAIEGRHQGLPLFASIMLLGRERVLARMRSVRDRLG
ncbi:MAG: glutamate--tRNA ligase [Acidimicrobiia bacterium]